MRCKALHVLVLLLLPRLARADEPALRGPLLGGRPLLLALSAWRGGGPQGLAWGVGLQLSAPFGLPMQASGRRVASAEEAPAAAAATAPAKEATGRLGAARLRRLVRAAWRAAGLDEDRPSEMAARARRSALLPEVRLRVLRSSDQLLRYTPTADDDDLRAQATGQAATVYEARLSLRLDRLVFADEEVALERLRQERNEQRRKVSERLAALAGDWQKATARAASAQGEPERAEAEAQVAAAETALDALTDGAWSASREGGDEAGAQRAAP